MDTKESATTQTVFKVKMDGNENTNQVMATLGFPFDERIKQKNFPLTQSETLREDEIEIVYPGVFFTEAEGLEILKNKGLERPTYKHAVRFAEQHGKATTSEEKPFVIFLHEAWLSNHGRRIVYVDRSPDGRGLYLVYPGRRFRSDCVLAGVRPPSSR